MTEWRKSSYSGYNGNCVEVGANWRKSSHSANGNCVEVAEDDDIVAVRDSKDLPGPVLVFSTPQWVEFLRRLKDDVPTKIPDLSGVPLGGEPGGAFTSSI